MMLIALSGVPSAISILSPPFSECMKHHKAVQTKNEMICVFNSYLPSTPLAY